MVKILAVAQSHESIVSMDEINSILLSSSWFRALPDYLIEQMLSGPACINTTMERLFTIVVLSRSDYMQSLLAPLK